MTSAKVVPYNVSIRKSPRGRKTPGLLGSFRPNPTTLVVFLPQLTQEDCKSHPDR